jgi:hypothetical protein
MGAIVFYLEKFKSDVPVINFTTHVKISAECSYFSAIIAHGQAVFFPAINTLFQYVYRIDVIIKDVFGTLVYR